MIKRALLFLSLTLMCGLNHAAFAYMISQDQSTIMTKDLPGASGWNAITDTGNIYEMSYSFGEQTAGPSQTSGSWVLYPGYYGGGNSGSGPSINATVIVAPGSRTYMQDNLQVGVPVSAAVAVTFSSTLDQATVVPGVIQIYKLQDHLGNLLGDAVATTLQLDPQQLTITVTPTPAWEGNTLYAVVVTTMVHSIDGYSVDSQNRTLYLTVLDPQQNNLLLQSPNIQSAGALSATDVVSNGGMTLSIPSSTLADYAAILSSKDPINTPLRVDPKIVAEATAKAQQSSPYRIPLLVREITGFDSHGNSVIRAANPIQFTLGMKDASAAISSRAAYIRPQTLSLWILDEDHHLWMKLPGSQATADGNGMTAAVTSLAVYALMGDASQTTSDVYPFPVPWRPHGPNAGTGVGQSGTEDGGITFASLPSECKIRIFTLTGELVRELSHSDITSANPTREPWDVKTTHGESVASGVYFWRVESATDSKNGKLMVIR